MLPVFVAELFNSCKQIDIFLDAGYEPTGKGKNIKFYILDDIISPKTKAVFDNLFSVLGIKTDAYPTNYGQVLFDSDSYEHKYTAYPAIGLNSEGKLMLRIGTTNETDEHKALEIPLVFDDTYFLQMPGSKKKLKLELLPVITNQGTPDEKTLYYVSASEEKRPAYKFILPFRMRENTAPEVLNEAWWDGKFETCCTGFNKSGINLTHAFGDALQDGTFPQTGVLLILKNGYLDEFFDSAQNKTYQSTKWEIAGCSHPNLLVNSYSDGYVPLGSVGMITASTACSATKCLIETRERLGEPDNFQMKLYLLHVISVNLQNGTKPRFDWSPKTGGTFNPKVISPLVKRNFAMFLEEMKPTIDQILNAPAKTPTAVAAAAETEDDENWDNKAF